MSGSKNTLLLIAVITVLLFVLFSNDIKRIIDCIRCSEGFKNFKEHLTGDE